MDGALGSSFQGMNGLESVERIRYVPLIQTPTGAEVNAPRPQ